MPFEEHLQSGPRFADSCPMTKLLLLPVAIILMTSSEGFADQKQGKNKAADFTALEFLQFDSSQETRNPHWPSRLTFRNIKMNLEEFISYKQGHWDLAAHCDGESARAYSIFAAYRIKRTIDGDMSDTIYNDGKSKPYGGATFTVRKSQAGGFEVTISNGGGTATFIERPVVINETNEEAILLEAATTGECPNGKKIDNLYIKIPTM